jgi:hypothetical protein
MKRGRPFTGAAVVVVALLVCGPLARVARADIVTVSARGQVISNFITTPPLNGASVGNIGVMSFNVDSNNFVEAIPGDLRSYPIIQSSFALTFQPSGVSVGLLNPFPAGQTPYFTLVDGFPVSDGFFVSTSTNSPGGVPISQSPLQANLDLGYTGTTLSSLNILNAFGTYDLTGLTRFGFNIWQSIPDNVRLDMNYQQLTIAPEPTATMALPALAGLLAASRRRRV